MPKVSWGDAVAGEKNTLLNAMTDLGALFACAAGGPRLPRAHAGPAGVGPGKAAAQGPVCGEWLLQCSCLAALAKRS